MTAQRLIVVLPIAEIEGELVPMEPVACENTTKAKALAQKLSRTHAGVIAWERRADPDLGEYGPPQEIGRWGKVPDGLE
jgi:hypothetical protein